MLISLKSKTYTKLAIGYELSPDASTIVTFVQDPSPFGNFVAEAVTADSSLLSSVGSINLPSFICTDPTGIPVVTAYADSM